MEELDTQGSTGKDSICHPKRKPAMLPSVQRAAQRRKTGKEETRNPQIPALSGSRGLQSFCG